MRRLEPTKAGYWYVVLTIALGVVALASANNVLYLMECLLLGGMILSGLVSERVISTVRVTLHPRQAVCGEGTRDELVVTNSSRFTHYCVEIIEWSGANGADARLAFIPRLEPGGRLVLQASRSFASRGCHRWRGLGVATAGPFGFARKTRLIAAPGARLVWPRPHDSHAGERSDDDNSRAGASAMSAEIRPFVPGDDARSIVWKLSAKGLDPIVRERREELADVWLELPLVGLDPIAFERKISELAGRIYGRSKTRAPREGLAGSVRLTVQGLGGRRTVRGARRALDTLSEASLEIP